MATRNVVPRADGEGSIGTAAKKWGDVQAKLINGGGAANTKLFMNAAATALGWAVGMKVVAFTRAMDAATGTVDITGAGFMPSAAIVIGNVNSLHTVSIGVQAATTKGCMGMLTGGSTWYSVAGGLVFLSEGAGLNQTASVSAWIADGATFSWTRTGATAAGTAYMTAFFFR